MDWTLLTGLLGLVAMNCSSLWLLFTLQNSDIEKMTREEKIKEAAQKYVGFIGVEDKISLKDAFKIGAEWALTNQWRSVNDGDLPTKDGEYLVLVSGKADFFCYNVNYNYWSKSRESFYKDWCTQEEVTHWMEIPELP